MDLQNLSIDELVKLRDDVKSTLEARVEARQGELREESERLSSLNGKTIQKPKYVHPNDRDVYGPKRTWHGRGSKPKWVEDFLKAGGTLDQLQGT